MKFLVSILVVTALFISSTINAQEKVTITATVVNVTSDKGKVGFALYNKKNFMKIPVQGANAKIVDGKSTVIFKDVVPGEYAIICYHDKNDNDKMDFSPQRMPLEDFGASNNYMAFAPPSYENAKFVVSDKNVSLDIKF
ncbi:DUF2141 domain-containing protein [Polaribacter porphyrae]|uniref:DUF2141 domain-containing protein n=1 Tax=Polaribacter porphyrae TaxID=1137780 RepID=A0A2S7WLF3_9FLAO|nr:DUF2141 domain-containing protein [Polaribacter porphyrae]PQJ78440.1 hypothetical protein BTO18_04200 [Polaribacter porphyrae]